MSSPRLAADFDPSEFLSRYWQQQPCLLKGFLKNFTDPLEPDDLAGLACEQDAESRLVIREGDQWQARFGPFAESDFNELPETGWTLLVQAVDIWLPEVAALGRAFDFLPAWRREDVMVSFASAGGGVGPHFDYYDVFLLQGRGRRRWRLGPLIDSETALEDNPDLRLLKDFHTEEEYLLESGDVLYIPPRFAHWGESLDDSLCYSIGFRAPAAADAILGYADHAAAAQSEAERYRDPQRLDFEHGEIPAAALAQARRLLGPAANTADPDILLRWFGSHVTEPRYPDLLEPAEPPFELSGLHNLLSESGLAVHPVTRLAWSRAGAASELWLFCNGAHYELPATTLELVKELCAPSPLNTDKKRHANGPEEWLKLLLELLNSGALTPQ